MKKAFTLIELLVVIAIIAILAAILFPVFAQAKMAAKKSTNISNVKQLGTSTIMYGADNEDMFPLLLMPNNPTPGVADGYASNSYTWHNTVQPYAKNWNIMINPVSKFNRPDPKTSNDVFLNYGMFGTSAVASGAAYFGDTYYSEGVQVRWNGIAGGYNDNDFWGGAPVGQPTKGAPSISQTAVGNAADMVMFSDSQSPEMWTSYAIGMAANDPYVTSMFSYCWSWYAEYNANPGSFQGSRVGPRMYWNTSGGNGAVAGTACSSTRRAGGQICTTFTDGHAKAIAIKEYFRVVDLDPTTKVYAHLYPGL